MTQAPAVRQTLRRRIQWRLQRLAYPHFACVDCIGAGCGYSVGCWCDYHGCIAPNEPPERWREALRWALNATGWSLYR